MSKIQKDFFVIGENMYIINALGNIVKLPNELFPEKFEHKVSKYLGELPVKGLFPLPIYPIFKCVEVNKTAAKYEVCELLRFDLWKDSLTEDSVKQILEKSKKYEKGFVGCFE